MTVSIWQDKADQRRHECDVAVVGAGIVGSYLAYALSLRGLDVAVLESRFPAAGATGRNAGMVLTGLGEYYNTAAAALGRETARTVWELTLENGRRTRRLHDELGLPYEAVGSLLLAVDEAESQDLRAAYELMRADGLPGVYHASDPLERGFVAALEPPQDLGVHPAAFAEALLQASGATVFENSEVYRLTPHPDGTATVRSRRATVHADHVLLATNGYSPLLHPAFKGSVLPMRGQVLVTAPASRLLETLCYADYGYEYFRQLGDGRVLLGGWRKNHLETEVGYTDEVTPEIQSGLEGFLHKYLPDAPPEIEARWSGVMGFTPDDLPLVGVLDDLPGVGYAVGFSGHGMGLGLAAADSLIELVLDGGPEGPFSARRFTAADGDPP
ncbi:MAG: FAD-binding oxidoreductase [Chloroflexia bacterium]